MRLLYHSTDFYLIWRDRPTDAMNFIFKSDLSLSSLLTNLTDTWVSDYLKTKEAMVCAAIALHGLNIKGVSKVCETTETERFFIEPSYNSIIFVDLVSEFSEHIDKMSQYWWTICELDPLSAVLERSPTKFSLTKKNKQ